MMTEFARWLMETGLSRWIRFTPGVIQGLQTVHILALAAVISASFLLNIRLLGIARSDDEGPHLARRYLPTVWIGVAVLALTGVMLVIGEPGLMFNATLQVKLALIVVALLLTWALGRGLKPALRLAETPPGRRRALAAGGAASILLWVLIALAGRFIAYIG